MSLAPQNIPFEPTWLRLKSVIEPLLVLAPLSADVWNKNFGCVYDLCVASPTPFVDVLYREVESLFTSHVQKLYRELSELDEKDLLKAYAAHWDTFSKGAFYIDVYFTYMNIQHIKKASIASDLFLDEGNGCKPMKVIKELALYTWKTEIIQPLQPKLRRRLLSAIQFSRVGSQSNSVSGEVPDSVISSAISSLFLVEEGIKDSALELYCDTFEKPYLEESEDYYKSRVVELLEKNSVSLYIKKVVEIFEVEERRAAKLMLKRTVEKTMDMCKDIMAKQQVDVICSEYKVFVEKEAKEDLKNMYRLLKNNTDRVVDLIQEMGRHIQDRGMKLFAVIQKEMTPTDFVEKFLEQYKKYRKLINDVFENDTEFLCALDKAMVPVINPEASRSKAAELVARYCDQLLKKTQKGLSESEIEDKLDGSITIFNFIEEKDVYQTFYGRSLSRRLVQELSQSIDLEEAMVAKLKRVCGSGFIAKFQKMLTDIKLQADSNVKWQEFLANSGIDLKASTQFRILQQGSWPMSEPPKLIIPPVLQNYIATYKQFYNKQFSGRRLAFQHNLSTADLKLRYLKKPYIVTMTSLQMTILVLFEDADSLTWAEIAEHTKLESSLMSRILQSLVKANLLRCEAEGEFKSSSAVTLNMQYTNKRIKFRIPGAVSKETPAEVKKAHESVVEDRKLYIQAAIVRVMKSRKTMQHIQLMQEVINICKARFSPDVPMIKKCIEILIDKNYISRPEDERDKYQYLA